MRQCTVGPTDRRNYSILGRNASSSQIDTYRGEMKIKNEKETSRDGKNSSHSDVLSAYTRMLTERQK